MLTLVEVQGDGREETKEGNVATQGAKCQLSEQLTKTHLIQEAPPTEQKKASHILEEAATMQTLVLITRIDGSSDKATTDKS